MKQKFIKLYFVILSCILLPLISVQQAFADEDNGEVGFSITPILPENQRDVKNNFFDLRMTPTQNQTIELAVNNTSESENKYDISVNQAYTNNQGFIDYVDNTVSLDSSLKYPIKDMISYEKEVTVPAGKSVKVPFEIQMPDEQFDGEILAAIQVTKQSDKKSNAAVSNEIGYILGLKLTETDNMIKREIQMEGVKAAATYGKTSIVAKLKNPTMDAIGKLKYVVDIKNEKTGESVKKVTYDSGMEMAPNSTYDFAVDLDGKRLVAGNYVMDLIITDAKDNKWEFNEKFKITAKEANDINKVTVDVGKQQTPTWIYIVVGVAVLIIIIVIICLVLMKKKKNAEIEMRKRKDRSKKNTRKNTRKNSTSKNKKKKIQDQKKKENSK